MKRLNKEMRESLMEFARQQIDKMFPETKMDALRKELRVFALKDLEKRYPLKDMLVLEKYQSSVNVNEIYFECPDGNCNSASILLEKPIPLPRMDSRRNDVSTEKGSPEQKKHHELLKLIKERNENIKEKLKSYRALIETMPTLEKVVEVWSEAAVFLGQGGQRNVALTVLGPDVISSIQNDVKVRSKMK